MSSWLKLVVLEGNCPETQAGALPLQIVPVLTMASNELQFRTPRPSAWHPEWCLFYSNRPLCTFYSLFMRSLCWLFRIVRLVFVCGWLKLFVSDCVWWYRGAFSFSSPLKASLWPWCCGRSVWYTHAPSLWTSLFPSSTTPQRNHQTYLESKSNLTLPNGLLSFWYLEIGVPDAHR